jgi:hypothetical protein
VRLGMIWLVKIYDSCWLEEGAEGKFKLNIRQDCDPEKQKLKGAVRTKTYGRHYCQHPLFKKGINMVSLPAAGNKSPLFISWLCLVWLCPYQDINRLCLVTFSYQ